MRRFIGLCFVMLLAGCSMFSEKEDETATFSEERLFNEARSRLNSGYWDGAKEYYE